MLVGSQIVEPDLPGPGFLTGGLTIKEDHIRLYALGIEDAGGESEDGVEVAFVH